MLQLLLITLFLLLATIITLLVHKFIIITRATIPDTPHITITGNSTADGHNIEAIPRIIWTYWHQLPLPNLISLCQNNWQRHALDHEIRILNSNNITQWIAADTIPDYFFDLPPYRQADWLRLQLLALYGGIWVDASIIMTQNLNWLHDIQQKGQSEYVGFYINLFTNRPERPIIENWFMAARAQSRFVSDLAREFNHAMQLGEKSYLKEIADRGKTDDIIQLITPPRMQEYLIMHVAASSLLDGDTDQYRLALFRAEDTAFAFHCLFQWSKRTLSFKLALTPCPRTLPFIIKLRGGERNRIEKYIAKGWYYSGSLLAKFLKI